MTDELDELLWQMWLEEHGEEDFDEHKTKIKQAIQALIDQECTKARIDELAKLIHNDDEFATLEEIKNGKSVGGGMLQMELVEERLAQLKEEK